VIWNSWMVKPARKRTDYRDAPLAWQGRQLALASAVALGSLPVAIQLVDREILERPPLGAGGLLHHAKTRLEPPGRAAQCILWIDAQLAGDIDHREQEVAELPFPRLERKGKSARKNYFRENPA